MMAAVKRLRPDGNTFFGFDPPAAHSLKGEGVLKSMSDKKARGRRRPSDRAGSLPSRDELRRFIAQSGGRVGRREIARAFSLGPEDKPALLSMIRELADEAGGSRPRERRARGPGRLPEAMVVQITGTDPDGDAVAKPV